MSTVGKMKYWLFQPVDRVVLQVPRALAASVLSAFLDCAFMIFLVEVCGWQPASAAVLSYLVGGLLQYILCSVWVFSNTPGNNAVGFLSFTLLSLGGLGITWVVMAAGTTFLLPYGASKVLALGLAFGWNFSSRKYLLFSNKTSVAAGHVPNKERTNTLADYTAWISSMKKAAVAAPKATPMFELQGEVTLRG